MIQADESFIRSQSIFSLRDMARELGVKSPTSLKKEDLIQQILGIMSGKTVPEMPKNRQGRPPKNKSKIFLSGESVDLYSEFDENQLEKNDKIQDNLWFFCDDMEGHAEYNEQYDYRDGEGYIMAIRDRQYLFSTDNCTDPRKAILLPKSIELAYPFRAGDLVKCIYKNSETYQYKVVNKIKNDDEILRDRPNYEDIKRVETSKTAKTFLGNIKLGDRIVVKVDSLAGYKDKVATLKEELKDCYFVNLALDTLVEDKYPKAENLRSFVGDSTKRNAFVVELAMDRVMRLVEDGKDVVLCINDLLKVVKYQNFMLGYGFGEVKSNSFVTAFGLLKLAGAYKNGATVTVVAFMKNDKLSQCGNCLLNELDDLNVNIIEKI